MRKLFWGGAAMLTLVGMFFMNSCKKGGDTINIYEPITVVSPDSLNVQYVSKGQVYPIDIRFTTDRPIHYAKCMYEIDTPGATLGLYPDTLFYTLLDTLASQLNNKYNYTGSYTVPTNVKYPCTIRFDVKMQS